MSSSMIIMERSKQLRVKLAPWVCIPMIAAQCLPKFSWHACGIPSSCEAAVFYVGGSRSPRGDSAGLQPPGPLPYNIEEDLSDFWKRACIARRLGDWFGAGVALGWCYRLDNAFDVEASMQGFVKLINLAFDAGGGGVGVPPGPSARRCH